eukprot:456155-Amphidinium_carterae.1
MDAHDRHFQTIVPPDSVSSPNHQATGLDAMACFADTSNSQSVVAEVPSSVSLPNSIPTATSSCDTFVSYPLHTHGQGGEI